MSPRCCMSARVKCSSTRMVEARYAMHVSRAPSRRQHLTASRGRMGSVAATNMVWRPRMTAGRMRIRWQRPKKLPSNSTRRGTTTTWHRTHRWSCSVVTSVSATVIGSMRVDRVRSIHRRMQTGCSWSHRMASATGMDRAIGFFFCLLVACCCMPLPSTAPLATLHPAAVLASHPVDAAGSSSRMRRRCSNPTGSTHASETARAIGAIDPFRAELPSWSS